MAINPIFPKSKYSESLDSVNNYILPIELQKLCINANKDFNTGGVETRLSVAYTDEIWMKLESIGMGRNFEWGNKKILDVCGGAGFLTYHILQRVNPLKITLLDISEIEINNAKKLLIENDNNVDFIVSDATNTSFDNATFDIVIGNSFLHHFYDLPAAMTEFSRILKENGVFVSLHEPTIPALLLESFNLKRLKSWIKLFIYIVLGKNYIDVLRVKTTEIVGIPTDIWLFDSKTLQKVFSNKFRNFKTINSNFSRAILLATHKKRESIYEKNSHLLQKAISVDRFLVKILPSCFFGSVTIKADK